MSLNPDMPAESLRLHMGELTAREVRVARAAIRWAYSQAKDGWFIPLDCMSGIAENTFAKMMKIICHGGAVDVVARVDGKEYRWECDGLKYAKLVSMEGKQP